MLFGEVYGSIVGKGYWNNDLKTMTVRHTLGCLLARVAGRSPLEYLTDRQHDSIRKAVISIVSRAPITIEQLIRRFAEEIERYGTD